MLAGFALRAVFIALATLPAAGALAASADGGPTRGQDVPGRPPQTVLRSAEVPRKELVVLVGGLGSDARDSSFDLLKAALGSERYDFVRFGADPRHPYDTVGPLDPSARALVDEVRERGARYRAVHLLSHSMGGAVVDRAFERGLSAADGIRTYVALAAPHDRSTVSRATTSALALAGDDAVVVRAAFSPLRDPGVPAIADLAARRPGTAPVRVARLDLRLASDQVVLAADAVAPGVETRTLLPQTLRGVEGHGGALSDPRVIALTRQVVVTAGVPRDERGAAERALTAVASNANDAGVRLGLGALLLGMLLGLAALRSRPLLRRELVRPLSRRVLERAAVAGAR